MECQLGSRLLEDRWLSVKEIAKYLDVRTETVYRWLGSEDKSMPGHKVGRHWKFKKDEVDQWVKAGGAAEGVK
ncbi:helix-turn-helix domain-containing protein [Lentisphaera marina]|uniref:helix-turn-helix domain-containing protein n=1 Tax=Lentisphaera marina TaxID=1111041 RepID=UPI0023661341|nr:helix-turn-helix domain-containing protein [Lentisphaera marina]MDD7984694.1 helix-turn-helix domain-containing protein [Lentisphaera marina]